MCSNVDDELPCQDFAKLKVHQQENVKGTLTHTAKCKKCDSQAKINLRMGDTYCKACLQFAVTHKFRSCLGKSKLMRSGEKVLMAYSGGLASSAMLHLTKQGLLESSHKKLRFNPVVAFINESAVVPETQLEPQHIFQEITTKAAQYGFPVYISSLQMVMAPSGEKTCFTADGENVALDRLCPVNYSSQLIDLFSAVKGFSSKEDLLLKMRLQLLYRIAKELNCSKICFGDTETRIAVRVLADIALGKGSQLTQNCGFADDRYDDVLVIRPLRETLAKEISFYVKSHNLETLNLSKFTTKHDASGSIQHCTESFVYGLEDEFRSTVSTIFRVGDKMGSSLGHQGRQRSTVAGTPMKTDAPITNCVFCSGIRDSEGDVPVQAIDCSPTKKCSKNCDCSPLSGKQRVSMSDVKQLCCYSCRLILNKMEDVENIPAYVKAAVVTSLNRQIMKEEISQFLLDPNDL